MEENSEAQMETDVSSTTDVSEVQSVTGSHGNIETVIVVEEFMEEDWAAETIEKHAKLAAEANQSIKEKTLENSEAQPADPVVAPQKNTPLSLKTEDQVSPPKDALVVRSYASPLISLFKPEQSSSQEPVQEAADSSSKISVTKDLKSPCKDQNNSLQKSPVKLEQPKDILPSVNAVVSPSKVIKKDLKSPPRPLQKSPKKIEECKTIMLLSDKAELINKISPKKYPKPLFKSQQKTSRSMLKLDPHKDEQSLKALEDCMIPMNKNNQKSSEKSQKVPLSEVCPVLKTENITFRNDSNNINRKLLDNPILLNALAGLSEPIKRPEIVKVQAVEESVPIVLSDSSVEILSEKSSDSTPEVTLDSSEPHNKSISRELKSLIKSAKESKIISECTQLTTKTRKSRGALDISSSSSIVDSERAIENRRNSDSVMTNTTEKLDKTNLKRSMRSQNPEFVNKVKLFLNSVTGKAQKPETELISEEETDDKKNISNESLSRSPKKKTSNESELSITMRPNKIRSDPYCWRCHWAVEQEANDKQHSPMLCTVCPRSFHYKCLSGTERSKIISEKNWVCPECLVVLHAESSETRSPAMKKISLGCLCELLQHALNRMMDLNGVEPFMQSVDRTAFPDYDKYVVHPMDLLIMKNNINEGLYGSTEAFLADAQWILHNSIIFNTLQSKLTAAARALVRSCKAEMGEIEACPECYAAAHSRRPTWFTDVCTTPHMLLWAKLKGFPYWPAKCMSVSSASLVDVRFFGAHDRAWVPARDCFLFSEKDPNNFRTKRQDILDSMQEAEQHIRNISRKYGKFVYPPFKTQLDPTKLTEQLKMMIPSFEGEIKVPIKDKSTPKLGKNKSRSNSKGSKSSSNDGEISDGEDSKTQPRKMADGAEIAMVEDFSIDKDVSVSSTEVMEVPKDIEPSRKRRRSELEEAVITIMDGPKEKRKCLESVVTSQAPSQEIKVKTDKSAEETSEKREDKPVINEIKMISTLIPVDEKKMIDNVPTAENKRPPIKMILKTNRCFKPNAIKETEKPTPFKLRVLRIKKKKSIDKEKHDKVKSHKRRNSKNKSLNDSAGQVMAEDKIEGNSSDIGDGADKNNKPDDSTKVDDKSVINVGERKVTGENKEEINCKPEEKIENNCTTKTKPAEATKENSLTKSKEPNKSKESAGTKIVDSEKVKDANGKIVKEGPKPKSSNTTKYKETVGNIHSDKSVSSKRNSVTSAKASKEKIQIDEDNTSLAVIARESSKRGSLTGLPTISSVRSLSSPQTVETGTKTPVAENNKESSIFTPTSTDIVRNMKDAVTKLNKLRSDTDQSLVGKVGVCAFARMPSTPPAEKKSNKINENVEVEIKTEPMDFDDSDRQVEKLHLMKSFSLRPVSAPQVSPSVREVKINKITSGPPTTRKTAKAAEPKSRAKKTLQQKKGEDGRSELNSKNSMVYIPIQPPVTQAPVRMTRPITINGNSTVVPTSRTNVTIMASNSVLNTAPPTQVVLPPSPVVIPATHASTPVPTSVTVVSVTSNANTSLSTFPTMGAIPTTLHSVHTVPLITSVNGQWTFSLQPIMSVGGLDVLDEDSPTTLLNGLSGAERNAGPPAILPPANGPTPAPFPTTPKPAVPNIVTSVNTSTPKPPVPPLQPLVQSASPLALGTRTTSEDTPGTVGEPPRLQHKPLLNPFDANTPIGEVPPPSTAGPITAKLNQNAIKLTDFFRTILEDTIERIDEPAAEATGLKLQLEESRWRHQQEIEELKHNHELVMAEMRATFEKERMRAVNEARRAAQVDLEAAVKVAKSKQWCANCSQEAQFYCCWNTSYCDYGCQRAHWSQHYAICMQQRTQDSNTNTETESSTVNNRLQSPTENLPKTTAAPSLSKAPATRAFNQDQPGTPKSIIVSMVEDRSGNTTVKCVGTYKPSAQTPAQPVVQQPVTAPMPIVLNKTVTNNDDVAAKKVVTSGGYLIVGAPNTTPLVTPPRRPQTIQYFS